MKHLLLPAALLAGFQPVMAGIDGWNGGTLLGIILIALWAVLARRSIRKQH